MIQRWFGIPVVHYELLRNAGRLRLHIARWILLAITCFFVTFLWYVLDSFGSSGVAGFIAIYFAVGVWGQLILVGIGNVYTAAVSLSEERGGGTMDVLLSTPLSSFGICFAKWSSVMIRAVLIVCTLLPFASLLFLEGGLSIEQVLGSEALAIMMLGSVTALALLCSVLFRSTALAVALALVITILHGLAYLFLLEIIPNALQWNYGNGLLLQLIPGESLNHWVCWRGFAMISAGEPVVIAESVGSILLYQLVINGAFILGCLFLASRLLRFCEQSGTGNIFSAVVRRRGKSIAPERRSWELTPARPWIKAPFLWRSIALRASFKNRSLQGYSVFLSVAGFVFLPFIVCISISVCSYLFCAGKTLVIYGFLPYIPRHFPFVFGWQSIVNPDTHIVEYVGVGNYFWRGIYGFCEGWAIIFAVILLAIMGLSFPFQMAAAAPKERAKKRMGVILSTALSNNAILHGFWYRGLAHIRGPLGALIAVAGIGVITGIFEFWVVLLLAFCLVGNMLFWGGLGLLSGLTSKSARWAQGKLAGLILGVWALLPLFCIIIFKFANIDKEVSFLFLPASPLIQAGVFIVSADRNIPSDFYMALFMSCLYVLVYSGLGVALLFLCSKHLRRLMRRLG